jgi:hypothetical protein
LRERIDVNVDELDRIIDDAMRAPLNETDGRTLKTAVHAMAERLVQWRNTEKTSAVLEPKAPPSTVDTPSQTQPAQYPHSERKSVVCQHRSEPACEKNNLLVKPSMTFSNCTERGSQPCFLVYTRFLPFHVEYARVETRPVALVGRRKNFTHDLGL